MTGRIDPGATFDIGGITNRPDCGLGPLTVYGDVTLSNGNVIIPGGFTLSFGSATSQMINLWSTTYGIGVQSNVAYLRTVLGVAFYAGGVHSNTQYAPGAGGTLIGQFDTSGVVIPGRMTVNGSALPGSTNIKLNVGGLAQANMIKGNANSDADVAASGQGAYFTWNRSGGVGETNFVNYKGGGTGGFNWYNTDGATWTVLAFLNQKGDFNSACQTYVVKAQGTVTTAVTLDFSSNASHTLTLTASTNCTVTFTAPTNPGMVYIRVQGSATTTPTITWAQAALVKGTALAATVTAAKQSFYALYWDGTSYWNLGASLQGL